MSKETEQKGELIKRIEFQAEKDVKDMPQLNGHLIEGDREYMEGFESCIESLSDIVHEAKAGFPQLQPIIVFSPTMAESTGDITTDILNAYIKRERAFADQQRQAETNIIKYVKEIDFWRDKWLGK